MSRAFGPEGLSLSAESKDVESVADGNFAVISAADMVQAGWTKWLALRDEIWTGGVWITGIVGAFAPDK